MDNSILINNVQIFDGSSEQTGRGNVLVVNSRIKTVSESPIPTDGISNVTILDGKGKFLMPGLIDAHWHAYMSCNTMMDLLTADTAYTQFKAGKKLELPYSAASQPSGMQVVRSSGLNGPSTKESFPDHAFIPVALLSPRQEGMEISGRYMTNPVPLTVAD